MVAGSTGRVMPTLDARTWQINSVCVCVPKVNDSLINQGLLRPFLGIGHCMPEHFPENSGPSSGWFCSIWILRKNNKKQASKQTDRQTNKQTDKQTYKQASKQASIKPAREQANTGRCPEAAGPCSRSAGRDTLHQRRLDRYPSVSPEMSCSKISGTRGKMPLAENTPRPCAQTNQNEPSTNPKLARNTHLKPTLDTF